MSWIERHRKEEQAGGTTEETTCLHARVSLSPPTAPMSVVKNACAAERTSALRSSRHAATALSVGLSVGGVSPVDVTAPLRKLRSV